MRNFTPEREAYNRMVNPQRAKNRDRVGNCQVCEQRPVAHSHEIASGDARKNCLHDALCQLQVCAECHREVQYWKPAKQIAALTKWLIKTICLNYCDYKQLAPTAVVPDDVFLYIVMGTPGGTKPKRRKSKKA